MKALTIQQPFCNLILSGEKRVENRTWSTEYTGRMIIHSSAGNLRKAKNIPSNEFGAALGTVELEWCVDIDDLEEFVETYPEYEWVRDHEHASGPVLWILSNPIKWARPIPMKGRLNLWNCDLPATQQSA